MLNFEFWRNKKKKKFSNALEKLKCHFSYYILQCWLTSSDENVADVGASESELVENTSDRLGTVEQISLHRGADHHTRLHRTPTIADYLRTKTNFTKSKTNARIVVGKYRECETLKNLPTKIVKNKYEKWTYAHSPRLKHAKGCWTRHSESSCSFLRESASLPLLPKNIADLQLNSTPFSTWKLFMNEWTIVKIEYQKQLTFLRFHFFWVRIISTKRISSE